MLVSQPGETRMESYKFKSAAQAKATLVTYWITGFIFIEAGLYYTAGINRDKLPLDISSKLSLVFHINIKIRIK